jgi:hypothetical protein
MIRSSMWCRSPTKVSDCQSTERMWLSKILSRSSVARLSRALSRADAVREFAIFIIAPTPERREHDALFPDGVRAHSLSQRQISDLPGLLDQNGSVLFGFGSKIFRLL